MPPWAKMLADFEILGGLMLLISHQLRTNQNIELYQHLGTYTSKDSRAWSEVSTCRSTFPSRSSTCITISYVNVLPIVILEKSREDI